MDDDAELSMAALVRDGVVRVRRQPLALARAVSRSWWRRLLAWRPWAPSALAPWSPPPDLDLALDGSPCAFELVELVAFDEFGAPLWRVSDGTSAAAPTPNASRPPPVPRSLPSDGMPCAR